MIKNAVSVSYILKGKTMGFKSKVFVVLVTCLLVASLPACAKVGSERWCKNMEEKSAADWTPREAKDYGKHCVFD